MKKRLHLNSSFYFFMGGIVASFACTILYESINQIGTYEGTSLSFCFEWISGFVMCVACVLFWVLASSLDEIETKFNVMINGKKNVDEIWFRAIRAVAEEKIKRANYNVHVDDIDARVNKKSKKIYYKLKGILVIGCSSFVGALCLLILSKVV